MGSMEAIDESPKVKFRLGTPRSGWLDLFVAVGECEMCIDASDAVFDSLRQLVHLALFAAGPQLGEQTCTFLLEPGATHFQVTKRADHTTLAVYETSELKPPRAADSPTVVAQIEPYGFALMLWRALRETESRWSEVNDATWSWPFPVRTLQQLGALLTR